MDQQHVPHLFDCTAHSNDLSHVNLWDSSVKTIRELSFLDPGNLDYQMRMVKDGIQKQHEQLQIDLNCVSDWAHVNSVPPYVLNVIVYHFIDTSTPMVRISQSNNVLDLCINMSSDCFFDYDFFFKYTNVVYGILRPLYIRDCFIFLIKHITQIEKVQKSITKPVLGMHDLDIYTMCG